MLDLAVSRTQKYCEPDQEAVTNVQAMISRLENEITAAASISDRTCPWDVSSI